MTSASDSALPVSALRLLLDQGFGATSVEDLAAAAGVSRSTFFRRFGSKEGMVFADMERVITSVTERLGERAQQPVGDVVVAASLGVFDHLTADAERAELRHRLLVAVPALRDRELVSTHRFESAFRQGLAGVFADPAEAVAYSAAVVAVHNFHLRRWLAEPSAAHRQQLAADLRALGARYAEVLDPDHAVPGAPEPRGSAAGAVVVTVLDSADEGQVLQAVRSALRGRTS